MEFMHFDNDDVPFDNQEIETAQQTIIKNINSHLNQARYDGLLMLDRFLPTCSKDALSKYGSFWITNAIKIVENVHSSTQDLTLACKVLGFLIEHCKNIPELHKQISTRNIKQIISALTALQVEAKCGAVYYLIAVMVYHYPEVCDRFQELIKKMILLQIDSTDENLVIASAKCYVLLSKATERSFKSPEATSAYTRFIYNEMLLCNSLHAIMDELFCELIELENVDIGDHLELLSITDKNIVQNYNKQKQRFSNLCIYLSTMLQGYEARSSVLPQIILQVLCRGLTITPLNIKNKTSSKEQMLYVILPKLHISLLSVLDALINRFAQELVPFGRTILELLQKILQWTSTDLQSQMTFSNSKPFRNVKIQAYRCLSSWLMNTSSLSGIETIANECLIFMLKDITPERDRILLTMHQKMPHLSKRGIKLFKQSQYENITVLNNEKGSTKNLDADLCRVTLITLQNILSSGTILLKETFYKTVLGTVIPLLYNLYLSSSEQNFYKENNKCRLELFRVLKALQMNPHITIAFPIQYCLEISHMATHDIDVNIVQEAKLAIAESEKIIHPVAPTLQLPRQQESDNEVEFENHVEKVVAASKSDKRSLTEEEQDAILSARKRPKIKCVEIIQNAENSIELIEVNNSTTNIDKSQTDENLYEDINKLNKNGRTEEELPKDTDVI
ncbi:proline-, glutamic acid- and leucine-rich protein 1-like [Nylanderia fulva]|uniref:proline-, glutamic acid- and leucine-rich protein 1-like n=1 Tax=Nylanderia fulva TaxID=613905 RepID=UPI0010FB1D85|nr:proline-, glutamic acid- and leucine-rich protein 1-like [Nylanderia fulva]